MNCRASVSSLRSDRDALELHLTDAINVSDVITTILNISSSRAGIFNSRCHCGGMLRLVFRLKLTTTRLPKYPTINVNINTTRAMATGAAHNEDLKASKLFDVSNFAAVVTGGGTGIGLMITQALVANGARVYITGRREVALDSVVKQYSTGPGSITA